jgi:hypothetical protein
VLGTLNIALAVQEPGDTFATLAAATPDTSLEVMKLSDSEMQEYLGTLEANYTPCCTPSSPTCRTALPSSFPAN